MHKLKQILFLLAAALLLAACTQDEPTDGTPLEEKSPLVLTASNLYEADATPKTRGTIDGNWNDAKTVAVRVNRSDVKEYTATNVSGNSATLTCDDITEDDTDFWWTANNQTKNVEAWYPYSDARPTGWSVDLTQTEQTLIDKDLMHILSAQVTQANSTITFEHMLAKVVINLFPSDYLTSAEDVKVTLTNQYQTGELNVTASVATFSGSGSSIYTITPYRLPSPNGNYFATYQALVIPFGYDVIQKSLIRVEVDGATYSYRLSSSGTGVGSFNSGYQYTYNITVKAEGLEVTTSSIAWGIGTIGTGTLEMGSGDGYTYTETGGVRSYTVTSAAGLEAWAEYARSDKAYLNTNCTLTQNITLTGNWTPIGTNSDPYTGTFDGNGKTITGLTINASGSNYQGLIGCLGSGGRVQNLKLENVSISGSTCTGGVVGYNTGGTVSGCRVSGKISGGARTGGIVGYNEKSGSITDCHSTSTVSGTDYVGGIAGYVMSDCTVSGCSVSGVDVTITGTSSSIGGIVGQNAGSIIGCHFSGEEVNGTTAVGGVAGYNNRGSITACYSQGTVEATNSTQISGQNYSQAGGVAGNTYSGSITACYHIGTVSGVASGVGGVVGYNTSSSTTVTACYWNATGTNLSYGIGNPESNTNATKVDDSNVTWNETALTGMNNALTNTGWRYAANTGSSSEPLVLVYNPTE